MLHHLQKYGLANLRLYVQLFEPAQCTSDEPIPSQARWDKGGIVGRVF